MSARLQPDTAEKAAKLIRLLGSDRDGEVLGAVHALRRTLDSAGHDLHSLAAIVAPPVPAETDWVRMAQFCRMRQYAMRPKDRDFISSMLKWRRIPTVAQQSWLIDL
jgi:hypothetical protein